MDILVFNHHSLPFKHREQAQLAIPEFLKICIEASTSGLRTILVDESLDTHWFQIKLAENYYWRDWYNQSKDGKDRDYIRAFRSIATRSPLFTPNDLLDEVALFDVVLNEQSGLSALRAAAWHEGPLVSFNTGFPWSECPLTVTIQRLNPTTEAIEVSQTGLENYYNLSVLHEYIPAIRQRRSASLSSGREIVESMEVNFPGVALCGKAPQQLRNWSASITILEQVKHTLTALTTFSQNWKSGQVASYSPTVLKQFGLSHQVSGESQTVANTPNLKRERLFWLPCGKQKYFEQHVKLTSGYRLHFYPDSDTKEIFVGYIGTHLPLK